MYFLLMCFTKVQISPTNDHSSNYTEPVLRKMFNGLVFMAVYQPYIFYSDNGVEQVDKWCEGLREQIAKGGLPTAFGVISYAIHKQKELTGKHVCHWYGELMMPHA